MTDTLIPGADPWSHSADGDVGALVLHGFTGHPGSMRGVAEAFAAAGYHVEMPLLPGHGTKVEDMLATGWSDWTGEAEAAYQRLAERTRVRVVVGLSMGGSLALWLGGRHPEIAGLVCINPATQPQQPEVVAMLEGMVAEGTLVMDGIGSDIADPDSHETAYSGTPLPCLISFVREGLAELETTYESLHMPLLLLTSPQDHVVDPSQGEFLATHHGGRLERVSLDRSYHVATQDYDKELIFAESVAFADRVTAS